MSDANTDSSALQGLKRLLGECTQNNIPIPQIRYRPLTEEYAFSGGDYDFLLGGEHKQRFLQLALDIFSAACICFAVEQKKREKTVLRIHDNDRNKDIIVELWHSLEVKDPQKTSVNFIWWPDIEPHIVEQDGDYRLPPEVEALYYLSHLHTKQKKLGHPEVQSRLAHYTKLVHGNQELHALFNAIEQQSDIVKVAHAANKNLIKMGIIQQRDTIQQRLKNHRYKLAARWHGARMRFHAKGNIIAFIGPDGVGKSTIIHGFEKRLSSRVKYYRFKKTFRNSLLYKMVLPLLRVLAERHHQTRLAKNQIDDHFGGLLYTLSRIRFIGLSIRRLWGSYLLADRYFHDFLYYGFRFEKLIAQKRSHYRLMRTLMPTPRCLVQLDAPASVITARKSELTEDEINYYRHSVFDDYLAKPGPYFLYLNTANTVENCLDFIGNAGGRMGIPQSKTSAGSTINLSELEILGTGNDRTCYLSPEGPEKCIKVSHQSRDKRQQNRVEYTYLKGLTARGVSLDYIARCHGWVDTSEGKGLVFERITDGHGNSAPTLLQALQQGDIDCATARTLLYELNAYLTANTIVFADTSLGNILLGSAPNGRQRLFIVDGLGARRYGLKLWMRSKLKRVARDKQLRQWRSVEKHLQKWCPEKNANAP